MNRNKRSEDEMYNVSTYTDEELYDILDLSNPTDRELEAKIIFLYRKYKNMQNKSGDELATFFYDIHRHFFENDEEEEIEPVKEGMTSLTDAEKSLDIKKTNSDTPTIDTTNIVSDNNIKIDKSLGNRIYFSSDAGNTFVSSDNKSNITYTKSLDYTADNNNPLLKETITKVISIDSQYRSDKTTIPTEFTFDLSEPLKDVVSLSLYSVQIPYTWYTIAKSYGSNFFYIKGNSPGINNGNHDIQVSISPGNYSPSELITAINNSIISNYSIYRDASFAETKISYNANTSLSTIQVGITNQYNENSYNLTFPYWTTPNIYDSRGNLDDVQRSQGIYASIPSFLGLNQSSYALNTLNSGLFTSNDILSNDNSIFKIDPLSTTITIIKYTSSIDSTNKIESYSQVNSNVDKRITLQLSLLTDGTKYSRNEIVTEINKQIHNNAFLSNESSISLVSITNNNDFRYGNSYYQLKIKPERKTTNNITNSKICLQFPDETNISGTNTRVWTGNSSCFRFSTLSNELQKIAGETPIVKQTNLYTILQGPYIILKCVNPNFISTNNDIQFSLQTNQDNNSNIYTVSQLINSINSGIINVANNYPFLNGLPNLSYTYNNTSTKPPNYSMAFLDTNYKFSLALDIEKIFTNINYSIDFTNCIFNSLFNLGNDQNSTPLNNISNSPLTNNIGYVAAFDEKTIYNGVVLLKIKPNRSNMDLCGNILDTIGEIKYTNPTATFYNYESLSSELTSYLINYRYNGDQIFFTGTSFNVTIIDNLNVKITLNLVISRTIVSKDYNIQFIDTNNSNKTNKETVVNFWEDPLNINRSLFIDNAFNLNTVNDLYLSTYSGSTTLTVKASLPIQNVTINFLSIPNTFKFTAYEDGVSTTLGTNDISISIPIKDVGGNIINYTRDLLITTINNLLALDPLAKGTYFKLSTPDTFNNYYIEIFTNINKLYQAKDYKIVFYDTVSYVKCFVGAKGVQNTTWDSTLGWILGFRKSTYYILNTPDNVNILSPDTNNNITIISDTAVSTNLFNYFLICLDDYNLNHLNDGLVTITGQDTSVALPSYADRSNFQCDPITGRRVYNTTSSSSSDKNSQLTQNQLYSLTQKANAKNSTTSNILGGESVNSYGRGPFSEDVFAMIPMKLAGLQNGSYFVEYGGTLQNNNRYYFGPVNIHRMTVKLISDKGNIVDLNGTNWSFSFLCQQLYKKDKNIKK